MTTDETLGIIANAKKRADIVPAYASLLPTHPGMHYTTINTAISDKWSKAGLKWIKQQAWKIRDAQTFARSRSEVQP